MFSETTYVYVLMYQILDRGGGFYRPLKGLPRLGLRLLYCFSFVESEFVELAFVPWYYMLYFDCFFISLMFCLLSTHEILSGMN